MISTWIGIGVGAFIVFALAWKVIYGSGSGLKGAVVREKIKMGAMAIDVRTPSEYKSGHYKGAKNIPLQELESRLSEFGGKDTPIVVYCASGMRSAKALKILTKAGFTDVMNAGTMRNLEN
jgi:phage shock protein E